MSSIKVQVKFTLGMSRHTIHGVEVLYDKLTIGDLTDRIAETEAHLSRITGLEVKIETDVE
jgi:hypothetical protein